MMSVRDGILYVEDVAVTEIAEKVGTPVYITSKSQLESNIKAYHEAFPEAEKLYAVKANNNIAIMRIIASKNFGADVFSGGELYLAMLSGFERSKILFNGNSKSNEEIEMALETGVKISVDSLDELESLAEISKKMQCDAEIAFRVNPDIDPKTHPKIATGLRESKFGIPIETARDAYKLALEKGLNTAGIHFHIGSQILELSPFVEAIKRVEKLAVEIEKLGVDLKFIDIGGGLGIDYERKSAPRPLDLAEVVIPAFEDLLSRLGSEPKLWIEPGRSIVGDTTILLTKVNAVKMANKNFVAVDAGFNILIRPAMYGSYHRVIVANKADKEAEEVYTIVGPICESGDVLARDRKLPKVKKGDLIAILDAGAYGFAMSSQYNGRPRCAEVIVNGKGWDIIREKETFGDLVAKQRIPSWIF